MFEDAKLEFEKWVNKYGNDEMILLKKEHSYAVASLMMELAFRLNFDKEHIALAGVIGLLHDIGRFEQFSKYHSFSDKNVDHAKYGCKYLFDDGNINNFIKTDKYNSIIKAAIYHHSGLTFPKLSSDEELYTKMIRDMDKVDIYKQMAIHFPLVFDANEITERVLKDFSDGKIVDINFEKKKSDGIIAQLAFINDFNFDESFDILVESDNFDLYLSVVEVAENSEKLWHKLREICFDKINKGISN